MDTANRMHRWEWALLLAVVGTALAIVLPRTYLPMNDAPSHIGTGVLAVRALEGDPFFAQHYQFLPVPLPYWATTLLLVPLIPVVGALKGFVLLMAAYVVLLPLGFYALMRTTAPENVRLTVVAALAVFPHAYWLGESNFLLGQVAVLFALTLFLRIPTSDGRALLGFALVATTAYLCHIFALTALLIALSALAVLSVASLFVTPLRPLRFVRGQWLAMVVVYSLFAAGAFLILFRPTSKQYVAPGQQGMGMIFRLSPTKLANLAVDPFESWTLPARWPALAFVAVVAGVILFSAWKTSSSSATEGRFGLLQHLNLSVLVPAAALALTFYLAPVGTIREGQIGHRFMLLAFLLGLGAIRLRPGRAAPLVLAAAVVVFGSYKFHDAWRVHRDYDANVKNVSQKILTLIPEHSRLLSIADIVERTDIQSMYHRIGNYAVVERHAYSANIMATPGQQALRHLRDHQHASGHPGGSRGMKAKRLTDSDWGYYDYLLVQTVRKDPDIPFLYERSTLVAQEGDFRLYRLNHASPSANVNR